MVRRNDRFNTTIQQLVDKMRCRVASIGDQSFKVAPLRQVTFDLSGLSAGEYTLSAAVYDWQTLERLPTGEGDQVTLGHVRVDP